MRQIKRMGAAFAAAAMLISLVPSTSAVLTEAKIVKTPYSWEFADERNEIVSGAAYTMMVRLSGKFITAASDGNVHQWENLGDASQQWIITKIGNGACKIVSAQDPNLSLTVENGDSTNGNNIYLSEYEDLPSQHFILHRTDDAYYITAECSGNTALDVYDISHENGANIDQWDYWGGEGQKFYIRPVDSKYTLLRGDMNNDGVVNAFDAAIMKRAVSEGFDDVAGKVADMNGDDANTSQDIRTITDFLLGKDGYQTLAEIPYEKESAAYLFTYFLGNNPDQERMSYAVSLDGYHFKALNNGREVYKSGVGTECLRDPYIFKGEDGLYYLLATDMKSSLGWSSNRNIISAKSTDLVHWFDETLIEIANKYPLMQGADRAWAPQAIYDPEKESYMIYYAARVPGRDDRTIMYYAYSKDMKKLDTEPQLLFAPKNGDDAIDSDIIYQNGKYYMYYKNETNKRIYLAIADHANGPYSEIKQVSEGNIGVEGPNIYRLNGTDKWLMMSDAYGNGYYVMQETTDLENFKMLDRNSYSFDFTPRHGYVIPITDDQYDALVSAFPSDSISPRNTGVQKVQAVLAQGESAALPDTVTAQYSNGGTAQFPVEWNAAELAAVDTSKPGKYTVTGKVNANPYANPFILERADPHVVKGDDGYYYFTASYPAYGDVNKGYDKIILRRSQTVTGLADAEEKTIWQAHSSGIMAKHIWAPEMHCIKGVWYMFFAAGSSSDIWAIRPYVLKCEGDPYTGTWTECGQVQAAAGDTSSFRSFSLDMTYFEHNGKHYVIWAEIKGDSSLFMAEINPDKPYKMLTAPILLTKPEYGWELVNHRVNEGAAVMKTNDKVYVFFSASGTGSEYCVGRLEANADANLMDIKSWTKIKTPVLSTGNLYGESGPGHNSFVTDENGNLLIVYHARPLSHASKGCGSYASDPLYDPCRHARIKRVFFAGDGTPVISMNPDEELAARFRTVTAEITVK